MCTFQAATRLLEKLRTSERMNNTLANSTCQHIIVKYTPPGVSITLPPLILHSATPLVLRAAIFWLCMLRPFPSLRAPVFSVLQSMLLPVLRSLILSVCVSSFCDFTILILRFRLLRFCGFEFQSADSNSSRFCRLQPFRTAVTTLREPALLQRYDIGLPRTYKCFT